MLIDRHAQARDRLIVALDVYSSQEARAIIDELSGLVSCYKVGYQLFLAEGMCLVDELVAQGLRVFLDLKMDDVEETIANGVREITRHGVQLLTILGSGATARAAGRGRGDSAVPKILSVTLLSSLDARDLTELGLLGQDKKFTSLDDYALWRAEGALDAGCDGLIASGETVGLIRRKVGPGPIIVSPGIRPGGAPTDDHKRATTPRAAIAAGADYLVVGRPIRNAPDRQAAAQQIIDEIGQGMAAVV